jgi:hypothetical protein
MRRWLFALFLSWPSRGGVRPGHSQPRGVLRYRSDPHDEVDDEANTFTDSDPSPWTFVAKRASQIIPIRKKLQPDFCFDFRNRVRSTPPCPRRQRG